MRAVNLLPRDEGRKRTPAEAAPIVAGLALLLVATVVCAVSFLGASASVRDKRSALDDAERQLSVLPPLPPGPTPVEAGLASEQSSRVSAVASAFFGRIRPKYAAAPRRSTPTTTSAIFAGRGSRCFVVLTRRLRAARRRRGS